MTVLTDKPEIDRIDAALLVEELAEIYSTPTPKGWREAEKSNWYWLIVFSFLQWSRSNIYTRNLNMNPTQVRLITIFAIRENIPNLP